jgi:hypothetical protein
MMRTQPQHFVKSIAGLAGGSEPSRNGVLARQKSQTWEPESCSPITMSCDDALCVSKPETSASADCLPPFAAGMC